MDDAYSTAINTALTSAKGMLGKNEVPNREEIQSYLHDGGQDLDPHKVAWCAAFVSASLQRAGLPVPTHVVKDSAFGPGSYAPNYLTYGSAVEPKSVQAGDILVANNGSHVGFAEGPIRNGPNGPEVQLLAGNERDASGHYQPGSYTNPTTGAVANRSQVGMVGERWVPLSDYSARRYTPEASAPAATTAAQPAPTPGTLTMADSAPNAGQYQPMIDAAAKKYGIDPNWFGRLLYQENRFRPQGTSSAGAQGFAQFMPATAKRYGVDVNDPGSSIEGSAHYLADNLKMFNNNPGLAAAAYNWGEGNVQKWQSGDWKVPKETQDYVRTITGHSMDEWKTGTPAPIGTTVNSTPATGATPAAPATTGVLPGFTTKEASDKFATSMKSLGDDLSGGGEGQQQPQAPQPIPSTPAMNVSPLLNQIPMTYGQTINSMTPALHPQAKPIQPMGQTMTSSIDQGGNPVDQPLMQPMGTTINSLQQLRALYGQDGGYGYG